MFGKPITFPYSGFREERNFTAKIVGVKLVRPWRLLWKEVRELDLEWRELAPEEKHTDPITGSKVSFPTGIRLIDNKNAYPDFGVGDTLDVTVGYADENQQVYWGVRSFTFKVEDSLVTQ